MAAVADADTVHSLDDHPLILRQCRNPALCGSCGCCPVCMTPPAPLTGVSEVVFQAPGTPGPPGSGH